MNILASWLASLTHWSAALTFRCPYDRIAALGSLGSPQYWPFRKNFSSSIGLGTSPGGLCRNSRMPWCVFLGVVCLRRLRLRAAAAPTRWIWRPRRDQQTCAPAIRCNSRLLLMEWPQARLHGPLRLEPLMRPDSTLRPARSPIQIAPRSRQ